MFLRNRILKFRPILLAVPKLLTSACSESRRVEERKVASGKPKKSWRAVQEKIGMKRIFCFSIYFQEKKTSERVQNVIIVYTIWTTPVCKSINILWLICHIIDSEYKVFESFWSMILFWRWKVLQHWWMVSQGLSILSSNTALEILISDSCNISIDTDLHVDPYSLTWVFLSYHKQFHWL